MTSLRQAWTAIVLAGQRPGSDAWASQFGVAFKSHVAVCGIPMLSRVVKTLQAVPEVDRIIVLAQDEAVMDVLGPGAAEFARTLECISRGVADVAGTQKAPWPILVVSADHPLLTPAIVSAFITQSEGSDLCFGMVERSTLVCKYPNSQRTWFKLRDGRWTGANLWTLRNDRVVPALNLWAKAEKDRKQAWKVYLRFGPGLFLRALTQNIGMKEGMSIAGSRLGLNAQIADLPFPEAAIDVDNPADLAMVEAIMLNSECSKQGG